jgi:hypothetical protein
LSTVNDEKKNATSNPPKRKRGWFSRIFRFFMWSFLLAVVLVVVARPFLAKGVLWYVNRTLNRSPIYQGRVADIDLHLWRGAYTIRDVRIIKTTGDIPVPLFRSNEIDLAVEWSAILHGKIVGQISINQPEVNFVDDPSTGASETGAGGPWLQIISGLFPFDINSVRLNDGSVHFRTYQRSVPVDVYLSHLECQVNDLTNVRHSITPLLTTVNLTALAMDQAKLELKMKLNPFSYNPTFNLEMRLLGLDITTTNPLIEVYGGFNVKRGLFDLVLNVNSDEGTINGYVKPLFRNLVVFDLAQDIQQDHNPIQVFWQAIVGGVTAVVNNYDRDQLGTLIPFTGTLKGPQIDFLATVGNLLRNAFIRAYLPRLEQQMEPDSDLQFSAPTLLDPISAGDTN